MSWEYRIWAARNLTSHAEIASASELVDRQRTVNDLNQWDEEGWELVSLVPGGAEWIAVLRGATAAS